MSHEINAIHKGKIKHTGVKHFKSGVLDLYERTLIKEEILPTKRYADTFRQNGEFTEPIHVELFNIIDNNSHRLDAAACY